MKMTSEMFKEYMRQIIENEKLFEQPMKDKNVGKNI